MEDNTENDKKDKVPTAPDAIDIKEQIKVLFWLFLIAYLIPALICLIINFFKLVIFGDYKLSEFDYKYYSFEQVNGFYQGIVDWFKELAYKLQH